MKDTIDISEITQGLEPGDTVLYHHSKRKKVKCKFIAYCDSGFGCVLEDLEHKKGFVFQAWGNQVFKTQTS